MEVTGVGASDGSIRVLGHLEFRDYGFYILRTSAVPKTAETQ